MRIQYVGNRNEQTLSSTSNNWLERMVLTRVGFFDAVGHHGDKVHLMAPDPEISAILTRDNPRLQILREMYENLHCPAVIHSQWGQELTGKIPLQNFRGESAYVWQIRDGNVPVHYLATYYYLKNSSYSDLLEACEEDRSFGVRGIAADNEFVTRDRLDSVSEIGFLRDVFGLTKSSELSVLDIGSGYGRMAWRLFQCYPNASVICVDAIPESSFLCEFYLNYRQASPEVRMVPLPHLELELVHSTVDVALAINSFTECTAAAVEWWLDLLCDHDVPYLFIAPHAAFDGGSRICTREMDSQARRDIVPLLEAHGFRRRILAPKYAEPAVQKYGVSPTYYHLFERANF